MKEREKYVSQDQDLIRSVANNAAVLMRSIASELQQLAGWRSATAYSTSWGITRQEKKETSNLLSNPTC